MKRPVRKDDVLYQSGIFLPTHARFDRIVGLPESRDVTQVIPGAFTTSNSGSDHLRQVEGVGMTALIRHLSAAKY